MENLTFTTIFQHVLLDEQYDDDLRMQWSQKYAWFAVPIVMAYIFLIFQGQAWMQKRSPLPLRALLTLWSLSLAIFSIRGSYVMISYLWNGLNRDGFQATLCSDTFYDGIYGFWTCAFGLSKVFELLDTMFIVLRKKELLFLHWLHHSLTLLFVSYSGRYRTNVPSKFTMTANYAIHALMYSYYTVKATGLVKIPKQVNIFITTVQILQMVAGFWIYVIAMQLANNGISCPLDTDIFYFNSVVYTIYFILFCNFYYKKYIAKAGVGQVKKVD